jgi:hypothetical protein
MVLDKLDIHIRRLKINPCLSLCTNINSKWTKDFNIRSETLTLLNRKKTGTHKHRKLFCLNRTPIAQQMKERIDKWDNIKLKSFYTAKETVMKETAYRMGEKPRQLYISRGINNQNL